MDIFKDDKETKRVIFNVDAVLAKRLEQAKEDAKILGKKLDVDTAVDKAIDKFLKKAEKKIAEIKSELKSSKVAQVKIAIEDGDDPIAVPPDPKTTSIVPKEEGVVVVKEERLPQKKAPSELDHIKK